MFLTSHETKNSFGWVCQRSFRKQKILDRSQIHQGRIKQVIRGATLHSRERTRALSGIPTYPRQLTYANTSQNTPQELPRLTAPSAAHLTTCFLPDSQQHGLSGKASSPLSPLQRFGVLNLIQIIALTSFPVKEKQTDFPGGRSKILVHSRQKPPREQSVAGR